MAPIILGYNKDLFDAAGMDYPGEDWDHGRHGQCRD